MMTQIEAMSERLCNWLCMMEVSFVPVLKVLEFRKRWAELFLTADVEWSIAMCSE
jgi:hypothetical protein